MTIAQYAKKFNLSKNRIYVLVHEGRIPFTVVDGQINIADTATRPRRRRAGRKVKLAGT